MNTVLILLIIIIKLRKLTREKIIAFIVITLILVSPGLSVRTYLQKFNETRSCKIKIEKINGNCFSIPLKKIMIKPITKDKKIIPNTSDNPATA